MLETMSTVWPLIRLPAAYRPHPAPVDVTPLIKEKEQNLHSTANSAIEEIDAEEEFFETEEFFDHELPSAPNGQSLQVVARSEANEYIDNLVGNHLVISTQTIAKKAVAPEIWTIGQAQGLVNTFRNVQRLLLGDWPFKSKASSEQKEEITALFEKASESLLSIEVTLQEKIDQAYADGKSDTDTLGSDIFITVDREKLEALPILLKDIQSKSKGLYIEGDTLSKRTYATLSFTCASLLSVITGIVLSVLNGQGIIAIAVMVGAIPSIVGAMFLLASGIATYLFFLEDTKNKEEAKSWTRDIEGLTNLSDELKKLKESEMSEAIHATLNSVNTLSGSVNTLTRLMKQQNDELIAIRKDVAPLLGRAVGRKSSSDSINSNSSGHDSGVDVRAAVGTRGMSYAEWKSLKIRQKGDLGDKAQALRSGLANIAESKALSAEKIEQVISLLIIKESQTGKAYIQAVKELGNELKLSPEAKNLIFEEGESYWEALKNLKASYLADGIDEEQIKKNLHKHSGINGIIARTADDNALKAA